ncbi:MAG: Fic family protein [Candidatus Kapaibacterium sp.]
MELPDLIRRINLLKAEIDAMRPLNADREGRIMQKFRLDWNYHSSNIEGNSLTFGETKTFLLHGLTAEGKPLKDHLEIRGHNEAIHGLEDIVRGERDLTEYQIKSLHQVILGEPYTIPAISPEGVPTQRQVTPGRYKIVPNHVRTETGEPFYFATPEETPAEMEALLKWYQTSLTDESLHPLIFAAIFHYKFIRIHPFDDGNGRIARLLMNLILMIKGYPPAIVRTDDKDNYYRALRQADGDDLDAFVSYIGEQLLWSLELFVRGAKGGNIEEEDDVDKQIALFKAQLDLSNDNIPKIKMTKDIVLGVINDSLIPLFKSVGNHLQTFDELFFEKDFHIRLMIIQWPSDDANDDWKFKDLDVLEIVFDEVIKKYHVEFIQEFAVGYGWNIYRRDWQNELSCDEDIVVKFDEFIYTVKRELSDDILLTKFYHQKITEDDILTIAKASKAAVLAEVAKFEEERSQG